MICAILRSSSGSSSVIEADGSSRSKEGGMEFSEMSSDSGGRPSGRAAIAPVSFCRRSERKYMRASSAARDATAIKCQPCTADAESDHSPSSPLVMGADFSADDDEAVLSSFPVLRVSRLGFLVPPRLAILLRRPLDAVSLASA